ncbi:helix-turn-helix domain-containing protein [Paenibacillus sp. KQZ6P-2]|uniref:Helix-turn-helix domain-containing protein n=1 Tax=Paenibacillus mangrovi TaxID=2931978 RepID=A0A9X1WN17_9BACL|nr:metalloregulator ArsR/SmtB family transcription factor [Paenibacillus mangrovi]MCJ8011904.1 helix-turn-helix domain-containing protein [Paenibacillus mangrovi]
MNASPKVAELISLLGDASRATILTSLMDGRFHTASELALAAGITPQTASFHLGKMVAGKLVTVEKHGRYRYYQLADHEIAQSLEMLLTLSKPAEVRSLRQSSQMKALREARTCYDHLAGKLGVRLTESMLDHGYLEKGQTEFTVTPEGERFFADFGLDLPALRKQRRSFSRICLDWSERQHHLAGTLGHAVVARFFELNWIKRPPSGRAIIVTEQGKAGLEAHFGISDL